MLKKYFMNCKNLEELKKEYRKLAFKYHPDMNKDNKDAEEHFKNMNNEYHQLFEIFKCEKSTSKGLDNEAETSTTFTDIIDELLKYSFLDIEICGSWIWVRGDKEKVQSIKDSVLKPLGFQWRRKKVAWSWGTISRKGGKEWDMDKIRSTYGSKKIQGSSSNKSLT